MSEVLNPSSFEKIKEKFYEHLEKHNLRKTGERIAILEEIYSRSDHFDADSLYVEMQRKQYRVSRATVYNTLDLLLNCNLIKKHQFGSKITRYEKSYGFSQHDHMICENCGKVIEFCDPRIQQIKDTLIDIFDFKATRHSLHIYGLCKSCSKQLI